MKPARLLFGPLVLAVACGGSDPVPVSAPSAEAGVETTSVVVVSDGSFKTVANLPIAIALGVASNGAARLAPSIVDLPSHGVLGPIDPTGIVTYTPERDYVGADSFTFKATDGITLSNLGTIKIDVLAFTAPIAQPLTITTNEDESVEVVFSAPGGSGAPIEFGLTSAPLHGSLGPFEKGKTVYTPAPNYAGPDSFVYTATENHKLITSATVSINVVSINDPPTAYAQTANGYVGVPSTIYLPAWDPEGSALSFTVTDIVNGTLDSLAGSQLVFTPTTAGTASFKFTPNDGVADGTPASVTVHVAETATSCLEMRRNGAVVSGTYHIDVDGPGVDPTRLAYCDQVNDGGGWLRVFAQDRVKGGLFANKAEAASKNEDAPQSALYSILGHLDSYRTNGAFEFRMVWPERANLRNIWIQTSNPTAGSVEGYRGVRTPAVSDSWGGLELSSAPDAFLDGAAFSPDFWYAVGQIIPWGTNGIPVSFEAGEPSVSRVELYVRPAPTCGNGVLEDLESCDDGNIATGDGCNGSCQFEALADHSCREIFAGGRSRGDGVYMMTPLSTPIALYCDMTRDGGGWTMIGKATAGDYRALSDDDYLALILNANDHVNPIALQDAQFGGHRTMAFLNRPTTNALAALSGHTVRVDMFTEVTANASGTFYQKRLNPPSSWDLWGAIRDARLWSSAGTTTGFSVDGAGTDFVLGFNYDPWAETLSNLGSGTLGCWPTDPDLASHTLNDGTELTPCRHGGLLGDGLYATNTWLFTTNSKDSRFKNDVGSRQKSILWLR